MTSKIHANVAAIFTAFFGFVAWLTTVPPEMQSGMLGAIVGVFPVSWQPTIGLWAKALTVLSGAWATYKAAHSGPQTPPPNPPTQ